MRVHSETTGRTLRLTILGLGLATGACASVAPQTAQALPEIRTSERNRVPACVTPAKLMRFLASGNGAVKPQFGDIARYYKQHGETWRVRWDYAFYQMIIETNYLKFVNNSGKGDVNPRQNNFAGIGTTGGGVPGDSFPDVSTGVLGQIQHLVVYSGEHIDRPVAPRTRDKQQEILTKSRALGRAVTFRDLGGRWAADRRYGTSIEFIATRFRAAHCNGRDEEPAVAAAAEKQPPATRTAAADAGPGDGTRRGGSKAGQRNSRGDRGRRAEEARTAELGPRKTAPVEVADERDAAAKLPAGTEPASQVASDGKGPQEDRRVGLGAATLVAPPQVADRPRACQVLTASYGGRKNLLIRALKEGEIQLTALQVLDGQEERLAKSFLRTHASGGELLGEYPTREAALAKAFELCPEGRRNG